MILIPCFFALAGVFVAILASLIRLGNFPNYFLVGVGLMVLGSVFGSIVAVHYRFMPVGNLETETNPMERDLAGS